MGEGRDLWEGRVMSGSEMLHGSKTWALQQEGCTPLMATGHLTLPGGLPVPTSMGVGLVGSSRSHTAARPRPGLSFLVLEDRTSQSPCS